MKKSQKFCIMTAAINVAVGDWPNSLRLICECIEEAAKQQCSVIAFSELTLGSIDARDALKSIKNEEICQYLRIIAAYAYKCCPDLTVFIGHPWQGPSADTRLKYKNLPLTKRDKLWSAYSCLSEGDISGMSLKQHLDTYLSRLEERDYIGAEKIGITKITLPKTIYYTHTGKKIIKPEKVINAGNLIFPYINEATGKTYHIYPIIGDQAMKNTETSLKENCIILNPASTPSTNQVKSQHDQLILNTKKFSGVYVRINSFGGMNAGQGDVLACASGEIITQYFSAPLTERFCVNIALDYNNTDLKQKTMSSEELTMRSQARWLFDYLTHANMSKVHIVLSLTGDIVSLYHVYLIHFMIAWHLKDLGLETLLKKLGLDHEKSEILLEKDKKTPVKSILSRILVCVFFRENPENMLNEKEIKDLVKNLGGKYISHDTSPLVKSISNITKTSQEKKIINDLHTLANTVMTLGVANNEHCISITNLSIDDLILQPRLGGKLHLGQISPSSSLYRHQIFLSLKSASEKINISSTTLIKKALDFYAKHHEKTDKAFEKNLSIFLKTGICNDKKMMDLWRKAQYAIHTLPISLNHNQQSIEHNMGLRIPNFPLLFQNHVKPQKNSTPFSANQENKSIIKINESKDIPFKITQASCNQTAADWDNNLKNIFYAIDQAAENNADLLALPELSLTAYDCGDIFSWIQNETIQTLLHDIAQYASLKNPNLLISIGHPWRLPLNSNPISNPENKPFNVQSLLGKHADGDARILMMKFKGDLYGEERGFERRHFANELDDDITLSITIPALHKKSAYIIPFGRKVVARIGNVEQGYFDCFQSICEEYWKRSQYDDDSGKYYEQLNIIGEIKKAGYEIGLYITAHASPPSPYKFEKQVYLTKLASMHGTKNMLVIHTDSLGCSGSNYVNAGARYAAKNGKIIVDASGVYSFQTVAHNTHSYDIPRANLQGPKADIICQHLFTNHRLLKNNISPDAWRKINQHELEASIRNQLLFLYDTMKKSHVRCFTQALSGGADSAWNVVKIRLMIELGIQENGASMFLQSLHYPKYLIDKICQSNDIIQSIMKHSLLCYYLASKNNSIETQNAARSLIENGIGGTFLLFNIQPLIDQACTILLEEKIQTSLSGITLENIQARIRQMITSHLTKIVSESPQLIPHLIPDVLIDNLDVGTCFGLANPNENEGRRGYTTFAGDLHSGEINPNGHLPKDQQLQQMHYIHQHGLHGLQALMSLKDILQQTPSAELQPKNEHDKVTQTDEKALGLAFSEATIINHARAQYHEPIKVFETCVNHEKFLRQNVATIHDKIYISYIGFPIALHKLVAAPNMQTYGEYTTSAKSSMQYPLISVNERYELARFTLYCLNELAKQNNNTFLRLTGYNFESCYARIMLNKEFAFHLHNAMHTPTATGGISYKLEVLYKKITDQDFKFDLLFAQTTTE